MRGVDLVNAPMVSATAVVMAAFMAGSLPVTSAVTLTVRRLADERLSSTPGTEAAAALASRARSALAIHTLVLAGTASAVRRRGRSAAETHHSPITMATIPTGSIQ